MSTEIRFFALKRTEPVGKRRYWIEVRKVLKCEDNNYGEVLSLQPMIPKLGTDPRAYGGLNEINRRRRGTRDESRKKAPDSAGVWR